MFSMPWRDQKIIVGDVSQQTPQTVTAAENEEIMEKEDFLLKQIDEFREKAKQLQELLQTKESKARELQQVVSERESKAYELEGVVAAKEREMQELNDGVARNVGVIMDQVETKLDEKFAAMDQKLDEKLAGQVAKTAESTEEIRKTLSDIKLPEVDMASVTDQLKAPIEEVRQTVSDIKEPIDNMARQVSDIKEPIENMTNEVSGMKGEILEKIHTEGVQVFRNTRDLIDEQGKKTEGFDEVRREVKSLRTNVKVAIWFGVVNFVVLVVFVLYSLGVFGV